MILESTIGKWVLAAVVAGVAILAPIHGVMIAVGFLIGADFITGVAAAVKRKEKITSRAMSRTVWKILCYQLAVISGFAMEQLLVDIFPVAKLAAAAIGLVEFKSLIENIKTITGVDLSSILAKVQKRPGDQ